ncbi:hypothetical protein DL546_004847 [Coniochaeta pulveracea]|uniref:Uncharacterized protein n=1 Tax=Coniochaeta pulveracea TaxID=177199 RepID=A0A420Y1H9_9PEZI|nr:hypothetical protein DL546_004847 [Coniochaeta pulveracea]
MTEDSGSLSAKQGTGGINNATGKNTSTSSSGFTRTMNGDDTPPVRRRPLSWQPLPETNRTGPPRRRSSTFSDYSLSEARRNLSDDILNPTGTGLDLVNPHNSNWGSIALGFALLPAVGGLFFEKGSSLVTDVMLLGLAAIFLHWIWYHSAQEVRVREETMTEMVMDDDSDAEARSGPRSEHKSAEMNDVPEEGDRAGTPSEAFPTMDSARHRQAALNELYAHEVIALASCFLFPILGAYLLHFLRSQLSRPSEGLVSNYNLTIFLLAAEIHPLSHLLKLVQARTLHLQRIVNSNPYKGTSPSISQIQDMSRRLAELEARMAASALPGAPQTGNGTSEYTKQKPDSNLVREVRNTIQPELDALNRAVRRYEKKATVLAFQTESRLGAIDTRLNDAITLAAAATKITANQVGFFGWLAERTMRLALMPVHAVLAVASLPFRIITKIIGRSRGDVERGSKDRRLGKGNSMGRMSSSDRDRMPSRISKR